MTVFFLNDHTTVSVHISGEYLHHDHAKFNEGSKN